MELWLIGESMGGIDVKSMEGWQHNSLEKDQRDGAQA
jgi:hypothetical protein